ncbi:hypothetical protein TREES_T100017954 [Tupaia chinensis]|uniref:Uncharacterized protein n=1 Tax=Tupaia chinensis TaxID=246437 RepID=L9JQF4_TUPCH|nr:hypothetical protein TREES_T100017954 [Tupaia chinensis]
MRVSVPAGAHTGWVSTHADPRTASGKPQSKLAQLNTGGSESPPHPTPSVGPAVSCPHGPRSNSLQKPRRPLRCKLRKGTKEAHGGRRGNQGSSCVKQDGVQTREGLPLEKIFPELEENEDPRKEKGLLEGRTALQPASTRPH